MQAVGRRRSPLTLFFHILNKGGVNALVIYKTKSEQNFVSRIDIIKELVFAMIRPQMEQRKFGSNARQEERCH